MKAFAIAAFATTTLLAGVSAQANCLNFTGHFVCSEKQAGDEYGMQNEVEIRQDSKKITFVYGAGEDEEQLKFPLNGRGPYFYWTKDQRTRLDATVDTACVPDGLIRAFNFEAGTELRKMETRGDNSFIETVSRDNKTISTNECHRATKIAK